MKTSSSFVEFRSFYTFLLLCCLIPLSVFSQTMGEREDLADDLNTAKLSLTYPGSPVTVALDDPSYGTVLLKSYNGGCETVGSGEYIELQPLDGYFTMRRLLKAGTEIDVPMDSHVMPCRLNNWLHHSWTGQQGRTDDDGVEAGYDDHCTDGAGCPSSCELFYTKAPTPVPNEMIGHMWFPGANKDLGFYDVRLKEVVSPYNEIGFQIAADASPNPLDNEYLLSGSGLDVVHGYRKQPVNILDGDTNIAKRVHFKLEFDYTDVPPGYSYIQRTGTGIEYIRSIELWFQLRSYGPSPACDITGIPSSSPDLTPYTGSTLISMKVGYSTTETGAVSYILATLKTPSGFNSDADEANEWLWDERDKWSSQYGFAGLGKFYIDEDGYLFFEFEDNSLWENSVGTSSVLDGRRLYSIKLRNRTSPAEYCQAKYPMDGVFCVDEMTGGLVYHHGSGATCPCSSCETQPVVCLDFCNPHSGTTKLTNVLAASARSYSDSWNYDPATVGEWAVGSTNTFYGAESNRYQRGEDAVWRLDKEYVYRTTIRSGVGGNKVHDNAGVFSDNLGNPSEAFVQYKWEKPEDNDADKWLNVSTVTQYAMTGEPVEEHDVLDIYSAAKLAHGDIVPKLVAANAEYESVDFESFEDPILWEGNSSIIENIAHSGQSSFALDADGAWSSLILAADINEHIVDSGVIVKFWVKRTYADVGDPEDSPTPYTPVQVKIGGHLYSTPSSGPYGTLEENVIHKVAQTGEWMLYQILARDFNPTELVDEEDVENDLPVRFKQDLANTYNVWIDDVRIQPYDAQMNCYVYDRDNLRPIAVFDDQHFGAYSQYNGEGKLVRTIVETERGVKTVAETQYHSYDSERYPFTPAGPVASISSDLPDGALSQTTQSGSGINANLLSVSGSQEGVSVDVLNLDKINSTQQTNFDVGNLKERFHGMVDLPSHEIAVYMSELQAMEKTLDSLESLNDKDMTEAEIKENEEVKQDLIKKREALLEGKLGLTKEEWMTLYGEMKDSKPVKK